MKTRNLCIAVFLFLFVAQLCAAEEITVAAAADLHAILDRHIRIDDRPVADDDVVADRREGSDRNAFTEPNDTSNRPMSQCSWTSARVLRRNHCRVCCNKRPTRAIRVSAGARRLAWFSSTT